MKKALRLWPFLPAVFLLLLLAGNYIITEHTSQEEPVELYYRPAVMYDDQLYLTTSGTRFRDLYKDSLECVGVLSEDVGPHQLPAENMQSCGCEYLVGGDVYVCDLYPDYLFLYNQDDVLCPFIRESAIE